MGEDRVALARCVGDVQHFLADAWGRQAHHHRSSAGYADLLSLDDVDQIVAASGLRTPAFRLVRDGKPLPPSSYTRKARIGSRPVSDLADPARVFSLFDDGATIVLQGLQRSWPPLARFCRVLEAELTHPVQANAYVTPPVASGLRIHADAHDVFALQTFGRKQWVTYTDDDEPVLDVALEAGACLYIPQGMRHAARTIDEPSVHITVGVRTVTWETVLRRAFADALSTALDDTGRGSLPAGFADDPHALVEEVADRLSALGKRIDALDPACVAQEAADRFRSERPPLLTGQLRQMVRVDEVGDATRVVRRSGAVCSVEDGDDAVALVLADRTLRLPARLAPAVRWVVEQDGFEVGELSGYLGERGRRVLVRRLIRETLLMIDS